MYIKEDSNLYRGIFWIKDVDDIESSDLYFQIPCDLDGNISSDFHISPQLSSKDTTNYNHKNLWNSLSKKMTDGKEYNYYPRGRVEIHNGIATIYCSPYIATNELKSWLVNKFNLTSHNGIKKVKMIADGSNHYRCYLDD